MATQATTFFSTPVVKEYLGANTSGKDVAIEQIADGVCARIERLTNRKFVTRSVTWHGDARSAAKLRLRDYPVTALTSLKRRPTLSDPWEVIDVADTELDGELGVVYLKTTCFYGGPRTTQAVYTAGFGAQDDPALPLFQEALDYCKFVFTRQANGLLIASSANQAGASVVVVPEPPKDILGSILALRKVRF
jgi:hypothetical protein